MAWFVENSVTTVPLNGAYTFPSSGRIAIPFPKSSKAKAGSLTSLRGFTVPLIGEYRLI